MNKTITFAAAAASFLVLTPQASAGDVWYYCASERAYYPYVNNCREPWSMVPTRPSDLPVTTLQPSDTPPSTISPTPTSTIGPAPTAMISPTSTSTISPPPELVALISKPAEADDVPLASPVEPVERVAEAPPAAAIEKLPKSEADYIAAWQAAQEPYKNSANPLKSSAVYHRMLADMKKATPNDRVTNWTGTVDSMGTNDDGDAWVIIAIAPGLTVQTWRNSSPDIQAHTLIQHDTPLYNALADIKIGQKVVFTATLIGLGDQDEKAKVTEPEMIAHFVSVEGAS